MSMRKQVEIVSYFRSVFRVQSRKLVWEHFWEAIHDLGFWAVLAPTFGEGNGTPLQYSCLENRMDGVPWWAVVHGVARSQTRLSDFTFTFHFQALEKEMATHSSVLAWRIPGMGEPRGLPSMGLHRVRHDWSDLASAPTLSHFWKYQGSIVVYHLGGRGEHLRLLPPSPSIWLYSTWRKVRSFSEAVS